jgi:hypothetical protein
VGGAFRSNLIFSQTLITLSWSGVFFSSNHLWIIFIEAHRGSMSETIFLSGFASTSKMLPKLWILAEKSSAPSQRVGSFAKKLGTSCLNTRASLKPVISLNLAFINTIPNTIFSVRIFLRACSYSSKAPSLLLSFR